VVEVVQVQAGQAHSCRAVLVVLVAALLLVLRAAQERLVRVMTAAQDLQALRNTVAGVAGVLVDWAVMDQVPAAALEVLE